MNTLALSENKKTKQPRLLYVILCCVFCGLYFLRDIYHIGISYYVIYALAAIILLTVKQDEVVAFFVSISAFTSAGFDGLFSAMLFGCVLVRFFNHLNKIRVYSLLLILMCVYEFLHYYAVRLTGLGTVITYIMVLLSLIIVQQYPSKKVDKVLVVNSFIAFSLFFVLMTLFQMLNMFGSLGELIENGYRTEAYTEMREMQGLTANQNYITSLCSLNMCLCLMMISKKMPTMIYIAAIIIFLVSGFLTVSKMFMAVIAALLVYITILGLKRGILKGLGVIALLAIASFLVIRLLGDNLIESVLNRFENEDLTTGRVDIVGALLSYMREHPLTYFVGMGIIQVQYIMPAAIHSSVFEVLGGWGVPGLVLVVIYISGLVSSARSDALKDGGRKPNGYNYLPVLMYLGYSLIGMLFGSAFSVVKLMVCIYALGIKERVTNDV